VIVFCIKNVYLVLDNILFISTGIFHFFKQVEQLGTFDPMPNAFNEKMCALNYARIKYHLARGVHVTRPVRRLLGLSGFLPLDPTLLLFAEHLRRRRVIEKLKAQQSAEEEMEESSNETTSTF